MSAEDQVLPYIRVLSSEQINLVHDHSLKILSEIGFRVDSENALRIFKSSRALNSGVRLLDDQKVTLQPEIVEWAIEQAPSTLDIYDRKGNLAFQLGSDQTHFGIGVTNLFYQEPETDEILPFTREHMRTSVGLGNSLPSYDIISTIGIIHDVDSERADLVALLEMLAGTIKPLIILTSDENQFLPCLRLIELLVGDTREKPFILAYFNPVTPLIINKATADNMLASIEHGLPIIFSNYGMAGVSTPIAPAGALALLNAELLAGLVFSQLVKPGTPVVLGSLPAFFDMKTMVDFFDPQTMLLNLACAEMMAAYGIPHAGTSGSTNGWGADLISSQTLIINQLTSCLGKVGLAPFIGGSFGSKVFSPALVVYASEIIEQSRQFARGFLLNSETLAFDELRKIGIGGNFLSSPQTMKLFRKTYYASSIFPRLSLEKWQESDKIKASEYLRLRTMELMEKKKFPDDQLDLINRGEYFISQNTINK